MSDDELASELVERMLVRRIAADLVKHDRYQKHGAAINDARQLIELHRRGRDNLPSFEKKRLWNIDKRYESVTGQSIGPGLEEAREELDENRHSLRVLSPFIL